MIKKKLNILLLLSLVLLFISLLGTTSYAFVPTENELKNFICNYAQFYNANYDISTLRANLDNHSTDLQNWLVYLNRYEGKYILSGVNGKIHMWVYTGSDNNLRLYGPWERTDYGYVDVNSSNLSRWRWDYNLARDEFLNYVTDNIPIRMSTGGNTYFFYTDTNIYTNPTIASGTLKYSSGYSNPSWDLFSGFYSDSAFDIDINADFRNNKAIISNDTSGTEYYLIPYNSGKIRVGNMFDYSNLAGVVKRKFRYKQSTRSFDLIQEYQANTNNLEFFDIADDTLIVFEYCQPDTTEFITFIPKADTGFSEFTVPIYYTSANTSVVNGVIDTGDTFSGDNYTNYNNDTNTDKIINNINNDNEVDSTLNEFISGDAEDIANKFGFRLFNQEYYDFIYNTIVSITNVLTDDSDVYFDYSMHGEAPTRIYASSFTTPNGTLKTFLTMFLVSCTVFAFYKYIADLLELISTGNILEALDEFKVDRNIFKM